MAMASLTIQKIKAAIESEVPVKGEGLESVAAEYAEMCRSANKRLNECQDYLKKGMPSEALHIAEQRPSLLDFCAELDFMGVERWNKICGQNNWEAAEQLDSAAVDRLNNAYAETFSIEPLLKEYRRAVRKNDTKKCIRLLNKINEKDPDNENWVEDIAKFEQRRIGEIREEYIAAKESSDAEKLAELIVELEKEWKINEGKQLLSKIKESLANIYEKQDLEKGKEILGRLSAAYAAFDMQTAEKEINAYRRLREGGYFKPTEKMQMQFDEAFQWYEEERKKLEEEELYEQTLSELQSEVGKGAPEKLDELLNILARQDRPIPETLENRALTIIENHELMQKRRRNRFILVSAIALIIIFGSLAGFAAFRHYESMKKDYLDKLRIAFSQINGASYTNLLAEIEKNHKIMYQSPQIQNYVAKAGDLKETMDRMHSAFEKSMHRLNEIRSNGFKRGNQNLVSELLTKAKENAVTGEDKGELAVFTGEWESYNAQFQQSQDATLNGILKKIVGIMDASEPFFINGLEHAEKRIATTSDLIAQGERVKEASPELRSQLERFAVRVKTLKKEMAERKEQIANVEKSDSLEDYLHSLHVYQKAFPDDPLTKKISPILELKKAYKNVTALPEIAKQDNVFWHPLLERNKQKELIKDNWQGVKDDIFDLEDEELMSSIWTMRYNEEGHMGISYIKGRPKKIYEVGIPYAHVDIYKPTPQDTSPNFKEEKIPIVNKPEKMVHCEYIKDLVSIARFAEPAEADIDLAHMMQSLYENDEIMPLLKFRLMAFLTNEMIGLLQNSENADLKKWRDLQEEFSKIPSDLHWLCIYHQDVKSAGRKAKRILRENFEVHSIAKEYIAERDILEKCLSWNLIFIGHAALSNSGKLNIFDQVDKVRGVWVVRSEESQKTPKVMIAAQVGNGNVEKFKKFIPGEPLFSLTLGEDPIDIADSIEEEFGIEKINRLNLPSVWPTNITD